MRLFHAGVDRLAMWIEDRKRHAAHRYAGCAPEPLDCLGPLGHLPPSPAGPGEWSAPSPRPQRRDDRMTLLTFAARAPFRGTAILVPPWKIAGPTLVGGYTDLLAREGFDVWLVVPPEHMQRAAAGAPSGHGFAAPDLARFRALFEQLVVEIRTAIALASRRGAVVVAGLSIGALASSFAIAGPEQPELAALIAPPADLVEVLSRTAIGRRYRALAERAGSRWPDSGELARALEPFDARRLARPRSRLLVAVGRHDAITFPAPATALAEAWGIVPRVYPRGHLTLLFCCRALREDLRRFCATAPRPDAPRRATGQADAERAS